MTAQAPVYHPREPTDSPLWKVLHNHYEAFKAGYDEGCEKHYGFFRPVVDVPDHQPRRVPSKTSRELIKKIWEMDPLSCPRCGHDMKIISLIHDPKIIERILRHVGLWSLPPDPHEEKSKAPADGPVVMEDFDDGWPGDEEPVFMSPEIGTELALTEAATPATEKP